MLALCDNPQRGFDFCFDVESGKSWKGFVYEIKICFMCLHVGSLLSLLVKPKRVKAGTSKWLPDYSFIGMLGKFC